MSEKEFNLLEEPWILVMDMTGTVQEVNLVDVLVHAHKYRRLVGEVPTQNFAILRLMIAVMQTVVYRYTAEGEEKEIEDSRDAMERWKEIWESGELPGTVIKQYLNVWKERFWLIHPERPFYQVPEASAGTEGSAAKLNGEISESNNKVRLFSSRSGDGKDSLSYAEAARWLIYLNGYDDTSAKPKGKNLPSVGAGWLGKIGIIFSEGNNLFETIMLNLVLLDSQRQCWGKPCPVWELEAARSAERVEISVPDNQAELLTVQSRRIILKSDRVHNRIIGYTLLGGDFFQKNNAMNEQMTIWRVKKEKNSVEIQPKRNDPEKQMWRDFANFAVIDNESIRPGIVAWADFLKTKRMIKRKKAICFRSAAVQYGDKDFFATDIFGDSIEFNISILTQLGTNWANLIKGEISKCDEAAKYLGDLSSDIQKAAGVSPEDTKRIMAVRENWKGRYYYRIDVPFRKWLGSIDPESDAEPDDVRADWRKKAYKIVLELGREVFEQAGEEAFIGRKVEIVKDSFRYYSSPEAFDRFKRNIKRCFSIGNVGGEKL